MASAALLAMGLHAGAIPGNSHLWSRDSGGILPFLQECWGYLRELPQTLTQTQRPAGSESVSRDHSNPSCPQLHPQAGSRVGAEQSSEHGTVL